MVLGALGVIESGLAALGIPHGKGALQAAAEVIGASGGPGIDVSLLGQELGLDLIPLLHGTHQGTTGLPRHNRPTKA